MHSEKWFMIILTEVGEVSRPLSRDGRFMIISRWPSNDLRQTCRAASVKSDVCHKDQTQVC